LAAKRAEISSKQNEQKERELNGGDGFSLPWAGHPSQLISHGTPKRSTSIPKPALQNVFSSGITTLPSFASQRNVATPSNGGLAGFGDITSTLQGRAAA
jgi:hypothetical protein